MANSHHPTQHQSFAPHEDNTACTDAGAKQTKDVEAQRDDMGGSLLEAQDAIAQQHEDLIGKIEGKLAPKAIVQRIFIIRWKLLKDLCNLPKHPPPDFIPIWSQSLF